MFMNPFTDRKVKNAGEIKKMQHHGVVHALLS